MSVQTVVTTDIRCDAQTAYNTASSTPGLPAIFPGLGPIPGVIRAWMKDDAPQAVGNTRMCETNDGEGTVLEETYVEWEPPHQYGYMISVKPPLSALLKTAKGEWKFTEHEDPESGETMTHIVWTYTGGLARGIARPAAALLVKVYLKRAMSDCLTRVKHIIEKPNDPPLWVDDSARSVCTGCKKSFRHISRRRHHCRACGHLFCGDCSKNSAPLPRFKITEPVRLCGECFSTADHIPPAVFTEDEVAAVVEEADRSSGDDV